MELAQGRFSRPRPKAILRRHGPLWRATEVVLATLALFLLAPACAAIAVAIFLDTRGSVLFVQRRIGRDGRPFRILKFRTMTAGTAVWPIARAPLAQPADDPRLTRVGRALRGSHLDELPQLLNVITGHMSLVGPRPLVPDEDAMVTRVWPRRHDHRPGLTGAWQLHRSSPSSVDELISLDRSYIATWSPWQDVLIVARTARRVVARPGR